MTCCGIVDWDIPVLQKYFDVFLLVDTATQVIPGLSAEDSYRILPMNLRKVPLHKSLIFSYRRNQVSICILAGRVTMKWNIELSRQ